MNELKTSRRNTTGWMILNLLMWHVVFVVVFADFVSCRLCWCCNCRFGLDDSRLLPAKKWKERQQRVNKKKEKWISKNGQNQIERKKPQKRQIAEKNRRNFPIKCKFLCSIFFHRLIFLVACEIQKRKKGKRGTRDEGILAQTNQSVFV